jgi:prevent-host-death family protein
MYEERETFEPANLSIVAIRSSDSVRDVFNFILPSYYRGRIMTITGVLRAGVVDSGHSVQDQEYHVDDVATKRHNGPMKTVGVRDLKNKLSEYLRHVRLGERILVTDRGEVVAELLPPGQGQGDASVPAGLQSLARRGLLTLGAPTGTDLYPSLTRRQGPRRRSVAELLDEERGSR